VEDGGVLGGTGYLAPGGAEDVTVQSGGRVAPGASIGTLTISLSSTDNTATFATGSTFEFELGSPGTSDELVFVDLDGIGPPLVIFNTKALGSSRKTLSAILNAKAGISPEMALRLSKALDTTPESWLNQQMHFDIWQAEQMHKNLKVEKLAVA
jgi:hypothetical protein